MFWPLLLGQIICQNQLKPHSAHEGAAAEKIQATFFAPCLDYLEPRELPWRPPPQNCSCQFLCQNSKAASTQGDETWHCWGGWRKVGIQVLIFHQELGWGFVGGHLLANDIFSCLLEVVLITHKQHCSLLNQCWQHIPAWSQSLWGSPLKEKAIWSLTQWECKIPSDRVYNSILKKKVVNFKRMEVPAEKKRVSA